MSDPGIKSWLGNLFKFHTTALESSVQRSTLSFNQGNTTDLDWNLTNSRLKRQNFFFGSSKPLISRFIPFHRLNSVGDTTTENCNLMQSNCYKTSLLEVKYPSPATSYSFSKFATIFQNMSGFNSKSQAAIEAYPKPTLNFPLTMQMPLESSECCGNINSVSDVDSDFKFSVTANCTVNCDTALTYHSNDCSTDTKASALPIKVDSNNTQESHCVISNDPLVDSRHCQKITSKTNDTDKNFFESANSKFVTSSPIIHCRDDVLSDTDRKASFATCSIITATSDSSLITTDTDDNYLSSDGAESDRESELSTKVSGASDTDTDENNSGCEEKRSYISKYREDVIDNTDSDDGICHWDRLDTVRTPWTCRQSKRRNGKSALELNKVEHSNIELDIASSNKKVLRKIRTSRIVESCLDIQATNIVTRPTCDNGDISYILGCPVENGYETDDEDDDASSWTTDCETSTVDIPSDKMVLSNSKQQRESYCLWDYFLKNQKLVMTCPVISTSDETQNYPSISTTNKQPSDKNVKSVQCKVPTKVRFNDDVIVHPIVAWSFAYRQARIGPWTCMARDRDRFVLRIASVEKKIAWCFETKHREKIKALYL